MTMTIHVYSLEITFLTQNKDIFLRLPIILLHFLLLPFIQADVCRFYLFNKRYRFYSRGGRYS